jgi:DNA-binding GntR family transcriptional regulator
VAPAADVLPTRTSARPRPRGAEAYRDLKRRLLVGEFPINIRLGEERLAALVGVSRTPVREALKRLHAEGLVELHPDGGYRPVVPDVIVVDQLYELREGLELLALQRPGRTGARHDAAILEPLRDRWRALSDGPLPEPDPAFVLRDEAFHVQLARAAGNQAVVEALRQVNERIRMVRMHDFLIPARIEATIAEHLAIAEAVLAGDIAQAMATFTAHLAVSKSVAHEGVRRAVARMLSSGNIDGVFDAGGEPR